MCFHFGTAMRVHFGTTVRFHWGTSMRDAEEIFRLQNGQDQRNHTERQGTPTSYRHIWTGCRACQAILILHLQLHFGTAMPLCASILGPLCASTGGRICAMLRRSQGYKMVRTKETTKTQGALRTSETSGQGPIFLHAFETGKRLDKNCRKYLKG